MSLTRRVVSIVGVLAGIWLFVWAGLIAVPDEGPGRVSLAQGLGMGAIIASAPIAALRRSVPDTVVAAMGGGMTIAGLATTPGGNLAGLAMAAVGFALMMGSASGDPAVRGRTLFGWTLAFALTFVVGMYAALSDGLWTVLALSLAALVAGGPWRVDARRTQDKVSRGS